jgi:glutamyl-tRNA(Gln) amidotransferase subunit D
MSNSYRGLSSEMLIKDNIVVGDRLIINCKDKIYEGILMPRYEYSDDKHIVIKLKNGYNIGISIDKITEIRVLEHSKESKIEHKEIEHIDNKVRLSIISTGGTIASKIDYRTGGVKPVLTARELYDIVPELSSIASIEPEILFNEYSENITFTHWSKIAEKVYEKKKGYDGIIITHGTDTMHYTSAALSFATDLNIPIVLVGSQRSSDRPSSDAATNLIGAAIFAAKTEFTGVFVAMHDNLNDDLIAIHLGTRVRKCHTSRRDAFRSIGIKPIAYVKGQEIIYNNTSLARRGEKSDSVKPNFYDKVALLKYHPNLDSNIIRYLIDNGYKGIVLEGTGLGHVNKSLFPVIKYGIDRGVIICMTSQCIEGRVRMTVYETGRDLLSLGVIPLDDMLPETALAKLSWVLANTNGYDNAKEMMLRNIAHEITLKSLIV